MSHKKKILFIITFIVVLVFPSILSGGREYFTAWSSAYEFKDTWKSISSHGGEFNYKIIISSEQNYTYLEGEVRYCGPGEKTVTKTFQDEIEFTTGDCWSNVEVRFRSAPNIVKVDGWVISAGAIKVLLQPIIVLKKNGNTEI
jgi:hypothetical protein